MKIEHIAMYVNNLEGAKDFFEHYCGGTANRLYHNPSTRFSSYFISFEDGARLELMHKPGISMQERTAERTGFVHLSSRSAVRKRSIRLPNSCGMTAMRLRADRVRPETDTMKAALPGLKETSWNLQSDNKAGD